MTQNSLFSLKIIKLFLLNSMENKETRKIGWTFLGFSTVFYRFLKFLWKRKWKSLNSTGLEAAHTAQPAQENTHPSPRLRGRFAQRPSQLWISVKNPSLLFIVSLTSTKTTPRFYPFSVRSPRQRTTQGRTPASTWIDRREPRLAAPSGEHRIGSPPNNFPQTVSPMAH
jgi:hypothetical protein